MRWLGAFSLSIPLIACAGDSDGKRPSGPPGGGVDPAEITPGSLGIAPSATPRAAPEPAPEPAMPVRIPAAEPSSEPAPAPSGAPTAGETKGAKMKMTVEHCRELGKKFTQLTVDAGGPKSQADKIGKDFAAKCMHDEAGQMVDRGEYDCVMAAKVVTDIPACKK